MTGLPASVEAHLTEAGFAPTEITALRKLLEGEALTLRELAAKTGKSTGVLDQAVKKLMSRGIVTRETFNDTPKYLVKSLDAVLTWMREDMEAKRKMLTRKERDFESFIASLKADQTRPEMEYFEGREGVEKAYRKLLESVKDKQLLRFYPVTCREEEDPLRDFRVQYFRERHKRSIFSRVIAQDTPLSRRYRSRDAFEYRETVLVPESEFPYDFEKIIAGDTVACFTVSEEKAYFIRSAALARSERELFEVTWRKAKAAAGAPVQPVSSVQQAAAIPLGTKTMSVMREFFLSRKSLAAFSLCCALAAAITYGFYRHNYNLNLQRVREQAKAIAATAAPEFDVDDLRELQGIEDARKPVYRKVVEQLQDIRRRNKEVRYAYILRPTEDPYFYQFVADADSLDIHADADLNEDGLRNDTVPPGYGFYDKDYPDSALVRGQRESTADEAPYEDPWGTWIAGHAPIVGRGGKTIAVIGIDIDASEASQLSDETFDPLLFFIGLFFLFVLVRLVAFNRPLFLDLLRILRSRRVVLSLGLCALIALGVTYGMYRYTLSLMKEQIGNRLMSIAATAAPEIDARDLEKLHFAKDMKTEEYQRVFRKLNEIRNRNDNITWISIMRPTNDPNIWEFVVDADSNYNLPSIPKDFNGDGLLDGEDESVWPGLSYDVTGQQVIALGLTKPSFEWVVDKWGPSLTGSAPIRDKEGKAVAILDITMNDFTFQDDIRGKFIPYLWFSVVFSVFIISLMLYQSLHLLKLRAPK